MGKDDFDDDFKSPATEAYERVIARKPPTDKDAELTEPLLKKLAEREGIPYLIVQDGFVLGFDGRLYPDLLGGHFVRRILQNAGRTNPIDRRISVSSLGSDGWVGDGGMLYSGDREGNYDRRDVDDDSDWETTSQQSMYEEVIDRSEMRVMVSEKNRLLREGYTAETNKDPAFYIKELDSITYQGRISSLDQRGEKDRQKVYRNIHDWYEKLESDEFGTDASRRFAAHFRKHIRTGSDCWYTGEWIWRYF